MRIALVLALVAAPLVGVGCSSSGSTRTAAAPAATSITSAPGMRASTWTTPSAAPAPRAAPVAVTPRSPAVWDEQPPVFQDVPQPPPVDMPAEATWTAPAPAPAPVAGDPNGGAGAGCGGGKG